MYEKLVYIGSMSSVVAKNFEFTRNTPTPVPRSIAAKLLRSPEFVTESDFLASQSVKISSAPEEEPVVTVPVSAPAVDSTPSPIPSDKE